MDHDKLKDTSTFRLVARLNVSGETVSIGYMANDPAVFIYIGNADEPTYMSVAEADMLISALILCTYEA